jgi:hypothetical protein
LTKAADGGKKDVFASFVPRYPEDCDTTVFIQVAPREMMNALALLPSNSGFEIKVSSTGVWIW